MELLVNPLTMMQGVTLALNRPVDAAELSVNAKVPGSVLPTIPGYLIRGIPVEKVYDLLEMQVEIEQRKSREEEKGL